VEGFSISSSLTLTALSLSIGDALAVNIGDPFDAVT